LGQLLTYAAGLDAAVVVWIAREFAAEHRAALDWLNEKLSGNAHFFGVEIEVLRIGKSEPAPQFNVVCRPNDWQDVVRRESSGLTENDRLRLDYWTALDGLMRRRNSPLHFAKVCSNRWQGIRTFARGLRLGFSMGLRDGYLLVYLGSGDAARLSRLKTLFSKKKAILEKELGAKLEISAEPKKTYGDIYASLQAEPEAREDWPRQHEWLLKTAEKFAEVFPRYL
jgi:hypothetical protein